MDQNQNDNELDFLSVPEEFHPTNKASTEAPAPAQPNDTLTQQEITAEKIKPLPKNDPVRIEAPEKKEPAQAVPLPETIASPDQEIKAILNNPTKEPSPEMPPTSTAPPATPALSIMPQFNQPDAPIAKKDPEKEPENNEPVAQKSNKGKFLAAIFAVTCLSGVVVFLWTTKKQYIMTKMEAPIKKDVSPSTPPATSNPAADQSSGPEENPANPSADEPSSTQEQLPVTENENLPAENNNAPQETSVDISQLEVKILNATETTGLAKKVDESLKKQGLKKISTGNAQQKPTTGTVIYYQPGQETAALKVKELLTVDYADAQIQPAATDIPDSQGAAIVIVIGQ